MAKYVPKRLEKKEKKQEKSHFLLGMLLYAVIFLGLIFWGLTVFWDFIEAYEMSRPVYAVDAYIAQLTTDEIYDNSPALTEQLNYDLQSEEACCELVAQALTEEFRYARKSGASSENAQVYVLSSGDFKIGTITIQPQSAGDYGFTPWKVTETDFDLTALLQAPVSMTIPEAYTLSVNGTALDDGYITASGMTFDALDPFNGSYETPAMVTYTAGPFLGEPVLTVTDAKGEPVTVTEAEMPEFFLDNCTAEEKTELDAFIETFIRHYIAFSGSANRAAEENYNKLMRYVSRDSTLKDRLYASIEGLQFAKSRGDKLVGMTMHRYVNLDKGYYLCDVTYLVDTTGREGVVQTTTNMKIVVTRTETGFLVDAMSGY